MGRVYTLLHTDRPAAQDPVHLLLTPMRSQPGAFLPAGKRIPGQALTLRLLGLCIVLGCALLFAPGTPTAHADGGAPNLAYVAGGGQGVSVIDIQQQKVTRNITLGGDPSMLYLTLDGRYLYVAQPGLNRVSMLATDTGHTDFSDANLGQPSLLDFDAGVN